MKEFEITKLTDGEIKKIVKIRDIPNFPYESLDELSKAVQRGEVIVGAAMDFARQWVSGGRKEVPFVGKFIVNSITALLLILPLLAIVYAVLSSQFLLLTLVLPMFLAFVFLRPMNVRANPILNIIIIGHYILIILGIFNILPIWAIYLGISVNIVWILNKIMYKVATSTTISASMSDEKLFVWLFNANVVGLQFTNGEMLWSYSLMERLRD